MSQQADDFVAAGEKPKSPVLQKVFYLVDLVVLAIVGDKTKSPVPQKLYYLVDLMILAIVGENTKSPVPYKVFYLPAIVAGVLAFLVAAINVHQIDCFLHSSAVQIALPFLILIVFFFLAFYWECVSGRIFRDDSHLTLFAIGGLSLWFVLMFAVTIGYTQHAEIKECSCSCYHNL